MRHSFESKGKKEAEIKNEIEKLYSSIAARIHPDKFPENEYGKKTKGRAERLFQELQEIKDPKREIGAMEFQTSPENIFYEMKIFKENQVEIFLSQVKGKSQLVPVERKNFPNGKKFSEKFKGYFNSWQFDQEGDSFSLLTYDEKTGEVRISIKTKDSDDFQKRALSSPDEFEKLLQEVVLEKTTTVKNFFNIESKTAMPKEKNQKDPIAPNVEASKNNVGKNDAEKPMSFSEFYKVYEQFYQMRTLKEGEEGTHMSIIGYDEKTGLATVTLTSADSFKKKEVNLEELDGILKEHIGEEKLKRMKVGGVARDKATDNAKEKVEKNSEPGVLAKKEAEELFKEDGGHNMKFPRTLMGLKKFLSDEQYDEILEKVGSPTEELSEEILNKYKGKDSSKKEKKLSELSQQVKVEAKATVRRIKESEDAGFWVESKKFGKIFIDTGRTVILSDGEKKRTISKVPYDMGFPPVSSQGFDAYVVWLPEKNSFRVYAEKSLKGIEFSQGSSVNEHFWNKPVSDPEELKVTLEEILSKLYDEEDMKNLKRLEEAIENEKSKNEEKEMKIKETLEEARDALQSFDAKKYANKKFCDKKTQLEAGRLKKNLEVAIAGKVGGQGKFQDWDAKISEIKGAIAKVKKFEEKFGKKADSSDSQDIADQNEKSDSDKEKKKKPELSEKEKLYVKRVYVDFAKEWIEEIKEHYSEEMGYEAQNIPIMIKEETRKFWEYDLFTEISNDGDIDEKNIFEAIEIIKKATEEK
jgi:hypothetical protein